MNDKKNTRRCAYVAGDENIFFPAIVALRSIKIHNSEEIDLFICFDADKISDTQLKTLKKYDINFIDSKSVDGYKEALKLGIMIEKRWPAEVYLNWCLPQYFHLKGYNLSLKLDYDVLCLESLEKLFQINTDRFFCSFLKTKVNKAVPADALAEVQKRTGLEKERLFSINTGVGLFNNEFCSNINFYQNLFNIAEIFNQKCPEIRTLEQAAIALLVSNYNDNFVELTRDFHQGTIHAPIIIDNKPDIKLVHYLSKFKPWLPFDANELKPLAKKNHSTLPFYRNIWHEFASTVDGYEEFCSEKPFSNTDLIMLAVKTIGEVRKIETNNINAEKAALAHPPKPNDIIVQRRRDLSNKIGKQLGWVVKYGPFKGLHLSEKTWWSRPSRAAMLLGIYEKEILDLLMSIPEKYDTLIDIGAADGYYAVGAIVSGKFSNSICYEISEKGQNAILDNGKLNNCEKQLQIFGAADSDFHKSISKNKLSKSVLLVDIEGAEFKFLTEDLFRAFQNSIIIVELHEWKLDNGDMLVELLEKRSSATHKITPLTMGSRDMSKFDELKKFNDSDRWLICSEGRCQLMTWFRFDPV